MKLAARGLIVFSAGLICLAGLAAACGDDDTTGGSSSGSTSSGGSSSGKSSSSGTSGASSSGASSSGASSSGASSSGDAGDDSGGGKGTIADGEKCTTASTTSTECKSGICSQQGGGSGGGGGGATAGTFCTIACDNKNAADPKCDGNDKLTGKCRGQLVCEVK